MVRRHRLRAAHAGQTEAQVRYGSERFLGSSSVAEKGQRHFKSQDHAHG